MKEQLDPDRYPFFEHSRVRFFLARKDGHPSGRIALIHNTRHNEYHDEKTGFFGFLDVSRDREVFDALMQRAEEWGKSREFHRLRGPASYSSNDMWGALVSNFDRRPRLFMPYNPPYLPEFIEKRDYEVARTLLGFETDLDSVKLDFLEKISKRIRERTELRMRTIRMEDFEHEAAKIRDLYISCWKDNWGFVPPTESEFMHAAQNFKQIAVPDLVLFVEDNEGNEVGFIIGLPDVNEALQHLRGTLLSWRAIPFFWKLLVTGISEMRVLLFGVHPEHRGKGLETWLIHRLIQNGRAQGIERAELSWILEDNQNMIKILKKIGSKEACRYHVYDRVL